MINKIIDWIKRNKLLTLLLIGAGWWVINSIPRTLLGGNTMMGVNESYAVDSYGAAPLMELSDGNYKYTREATPQPDITNRKVVVNSNFSLLVKDVTGTVEMIKEKTLQMAGYMVNTNINRTEYGETAILQLRVPSEKVEEMSKYLRGIAVKVVSENVDGHDVTDQYVDIERRLGDLEAQRSRMLAILEKATTVNEMLTVQQALNQIQDQIDSYKGQLQYMDGTTKTSKLTIYVSTDELGLPYTPAQSWRPQVIFKQAVRSMLGTLQDIGSFAIWLAVYLPIILGAVAVFVIIKKIIRKRSKPVQTL
ncbi:TPA: hypothetical protein DCL89_00680 [candidate division WWE3 bacterium]|uniref:DUF4349 domain-containing protein n=3 Tax=Katanobacteria TaxID=422282 RepID=A0A1F4W134_UNCKA|nr:MAG: hypothetical protein A2200_02930 [candidate division WWE3 bacterium RIFOXYA1_FULL_41_11]OGC63070.1 MAG: hypothetical protein A2399_03670 [candidate division WWE3 bacterium RIFOXYB1_FULL_42_27]OGC72217.1 MAG: hypothetical protein A2578_00880 [candidate division WWE3 bacterium RIFOXYD1_FULL_42_24]OGC75512.1 MAG: hypothetical protein A2425_00275 [candidate division WWE3 bacterium RIFOXYC1_FULL_42_17]HAI62725.1 hypothetical protein [candidate division WWE3 bacterium]